MFSTGSQCHGGTQPCISARSVKKKDSPSFLFLLDPFVYEVFWYLISTGVSLSGLQEFIRYEFSREIFIYDSSVGTIKTFFFVYARSHLKLPSSEECVILALRIGVLKIFSSRM